MRTFSNIFWQKNEKRIDDQCLWFVVCARGVSHPEYPSVLKALEIEDPVVANCLIDQRAIECILLIKVSSLENQIFLVILEDLFSHISQRVDVISVYI